MVSTSRFPVITSVQNATIKEVAQLQQRKYRRKAHACLVDTPHAIDEALKAGQSLTHLYVLDEDEARWTPWIDQWLESYPQLSELPPTAVTRSVMGKLSQTDSAASVVAVVQIPHHRWEDWDTWLSAHPGTTLLVLDRLQDPGNLGTLIRSAKAFGVKAILLSEGCCDPWNGKVIRGTAGMGFHLPLFETGQSITEVAQTLQSHDIHVHLTTSHDHPGAQSLWKVAATPQGSSHALFLGSEGQGLPEELLAGDVLNPEWTHTVTIPIAPDVESLNVAISGSIILATWYNHRL